MSTRHVLLGLLASGPSHGYDLKRRHDEQFPEARPLAYGQVYTTLQRLVRDGLAEIDGTESDGGPERTAYRMTEAGERELARWAGEIAPPAPFVTNEIFAKVVVSILSGGDPAAYLRAQRAAHMGRMRELTAVKSAAGAGLATVLSADYALNHLDADLRWMTTTADRLTTLTAEVDAA
ncbi:PadR family transcriptional regulator [Streptomyces hirsutus]|uniref:PadR family transcriptional regulator n=1 Tax=Streptomyces hirsutus TaxID=35620 RepID=UPI003333679C